jgi:hypothetical protein
MGKRASLFNSVGDEVKAFYNVDARTTTTTTTTMTTAAATNESNLSTNRR